MPMSFSLSSSTGIGSGVKRPAPISTTMVGSKSVNIITNAQIPMGKTYANKESPVDAHARKFPVIKQIQTKPGSYVPAKSYMKDVPAKVSQSPSRLGGNPVRTNLFETKTKEQIRTVIKGKSAQNIKEKLVPATERLHPLEFIMSSKSKPRTPDGMIRTPKTENTFEVKGRLPGLKNLPPDIVSEMDTRPTGANKAIELGRALPPEVYRADELPDPAKITDDIINEDKPNNSSLFMLIGMIAVLVFLSAKGIIHA